MHPDTPIQQLEHDLGILSLPTVIMATFSPLGHTLDPAEHQVETTKPRSHSVSAVMCHSSDWREYPKGFLPLKVYNHLSGWFRTCAEALRGYVHSH